MRVMTWNIQWGRGADGRVDLARTVAVIRRHDPDVLCLQEVAAHHPELPGGAAGSQVDIILQCFPGWTGIYGIGSDLPGDGERRLFGNMVLTRLPALQAFRHGLPWPADPAVPSMPRVAVEVVVETPWGALRISTSHLEYYSAVQRRAQVEGLRRIHAEACGHAGSLRPDRDVDAPFRALPRPASAVFCGDFNFPPEAPEYGRLQASIDGAPPLVDAWTLAHPGAPHAPSVGLHGAEWPDHPFCCDFFFITPDLAPRLQSIEVIVDTAASDHQPVLMELA